MSASVSTSGSKGTLHDCGPTDDVSLVRDDVPFRCQRRVGLIPREGGLGVGRRALFLTTLTWLPIAVWAGWAGRAVGRGALFSTPHPWLPTPLGPGGGARALPEQTQAVEPLLQHFGVHT